MSRLSQLQLLLAIALAVPIATQAQVRALEAWSDWVLEDHPQHACAFAFGEQTRQCLWPGPLELDDRDGTLRFEQRLRLDAEQTVILPGDDRNWPQQVAVTNSATSSVPTRAAVLAKDNRPVLQLPPGEYRIRGVLANDQNQLTVAPETAIVELNGRALIIAEGAVSLTQQQVSVSDADGVLEAQVFRLLSDGDTQILTTRIALKVAGAAREVLLPGVLHEGWSPMSLDTGELPARLLADGALQMRVIPGDHQITLQSYAPITLDRTQIDTSPASVEVWSVAADPQLRQRRVEGASAIDPSRFGVPDDWRALPAYLIEPPTPFNLLEGQRGRVAAEQPLQVRRQLWLSYDASRWLARDQVTGLIPIDQRLQTTAPWTLEAASQHSVPLVITTVADRSGLELRGQSLNVAATLTAASGQALPINAWDAASQELTATLHLPPGTKLLTVSGADSISNAWLSNWNLASTFGLVLTTFVALRVLGLFGGLVIGSYLVLSWHAPAAPIWSMLFALAALALSQVLPEGRATKLGRLIAQAFWLLVAIFSLFFVAQQLRWTVYPQLEPTSTLPVTSYSERAVDAVQASLYESEDIAPASKRVQTPSAPAPAAGVATVGPPVPSWQWRQHTVSWSGVVTPTETFRPWVLGVNAHRAWRLMSVLLLLAGLALLARSLRPTRAVGSATVAALVALFAVGSANAQTFPPPELLETLTTRLTTPPDCAPSCVDITNGQLTIDGDALSLTMQVAAGAYASMALPQVDDWTLRSVLLDGQTRSLASNQPLLSTAIAPGVHRLDLRWQRHAGDASATLDFPLRPRTLRLLGDDYSLRGVRNGVPTADAITLVPTDGVDQPLSDPRSAPAVFAPLVRVTRTLGFSQRWTVATTVERIAPTQGAFTVNIPLLEFEQPIGANLAIEQGSVQLVFAADQRQLNWQSIMQERQPFALQASAAPDRVEIWQWLSNPNWRIDVQQAPPVSPTPGSPFTRHVPYPGESLVLSASAPTPVDGATRVVSALGLVSTLGGRSVSHQLSADVEATVASEMKWMFPADAQALNVTINGQPIDTDGTADIELPIQPLGNQLRADWRSEASTGIWFTTPIAATAAAVGNIELTVNVPRDRWVLFTYGPRQGPAVLYWSELLIFIVVATALARWRRTPLRAWQWLLLGLGFSTWSWSAFVLFAIWLHLVYWRKNSAGGEPAWQFNLLQLLTAFVTALSLLILLIAIPAGMLAHPDMSVIGNQSSASTLRWYADIGAGELPQATVITAPLLAYQIAMLVWAIWLVQALIGWLRDTVNALSHNGWWQSGKR